MAPTPIFISHLTQETALAQLLKNALATDFKSPLDVFVSSDGASIGIGDKWFDTLSKALKRARLVLVLCSHESVNRPWVNFELGAAWTRKVKILPVCHSGLSPSALPFPLSTLQASQANKGEGLRALYRTIAEAVAIEAPERDFEALAASVRAVEKALADAAADRLLEPRILCAATPQFAEPAYGFDGDVAAVERAFPGRVTVARNLSPQTLRDFLTREGERFDIVHLVQGVDPDRGDLWFHRLDPKTFREATSPIDRMSADGFADLVKEAGVRLVVLNTCQALYLAARISPITNMVATPIQISGKEGAAWVDYFYGFLARGDSLFKAADRACAQLPDLRMVLIRHKDFVVATKDRAKAVSAG